MKYKNIVLIGMPGAGKSTLGILLAKKNNKDFVDTDLLIQLKSNSTLQALLDQSGYLKLRELEEQVLISLNCSNHIIATGGSAVYSDAGMANLKKDALVIYLDISLSELKNRVKDFSSRGIASKPGDDLAALYQERQKLYEKFADVTIDCDNKSPEDVLNDIQNSLRSI